MGAITLYSDETQISLNWHTFPILITIRISDAQSVLVDGKSPIRKLAVMLM